jgi:arginyl-tRNA synthetase
VSLSLCFRRFASLSTSGASETKSVLDLLRDQVNQSLQDSLGIPLGDQDPMVLPCKPGGGGAAVHGDYQSNVAMSLAKRLRASPRDVAQRVLAALPVGMPGTLLASADISGPGFINLHLSQDFLKQRLFSMATDSEGRLGIGRKPRQRIVVDFSSPNIAKEMHVVSE